jgi:hypothetical protein
MPASGLLRGTDIVTSGRHVRKVPTTVMRKKQSPHRVCTGRGLRTDGWFEARGHERKKIEMRFAHFAEAAGGFGGSIAIRSASLRIAA